MVGWLTLRPRTVPWVSPSTLQPLATIQADLAAGPRAALEGIGGGLLLLAPLGVLLALAAGWLYRPRAATALRTVAAGVLCSLVLAVLRSGTPGQVVTADSVLLNAIGIALAHLVFFPPLRARLLRGRGRGELSRIELRQEGFGVRPGAIPGSVSPRGATRPPGARSYVGVESPVRSIPPRTPGVGNHSR